MTTETESVETLPKTLPGVVCAQWRKCGKAGCRCARGAPHGPYFYRFWRHNGRQHKAYVRKADVEDVRGRCLARRQARAEWIAAMQEIREMASFLKPGAPMNALATQEQMEQKTIARECTASFGRALAWYCSHFRMTTEEAMARMNENAEEVAQEILQRPPDEINWHDIDHVGQLDPPKALELWEEIKTQALEELRSGHRSAKALQPVVNHPWHRARFLALRHELAEEWQPRNGIERQLIDTMALAQSAYFEWLEKLACRTSRDSVSQKKLDEEAPWMPPRMCEAEAVEQAAAMMDRLNKMFLRSLRALSDLRRYNRPVVVQNVGQVNVGGQQVNVSSG